MKRAALLITLAFVLNLSILAQDGALSRERNAADKPETSGEIEAERTPQLERLYELVGSAEKIVVTIDSNDESKVLFESSNPRDLIEFQNALKLVIPDQWSLSICAEPRISLYKDGKEIASINNVLGYAVKTSVWSGNALVADSEKWLQWFDARGMPRVRKERDDADAENKRYTKEEASWYAAMPRGLKESYEKQRYRVGIPGKYDLREMNVALQDEYPDPNDRMLSLLHWYGSGSDSWSSSYDYEVIAEKLLFQYATADIVGALHKVKPTETQIEGAVKFFAGWDFSRTRGKELDQIPAALKKELLSHALKSEDVDKRERAKSAFGEK